MVADYADDEVISSSADLTIAFTNLQTHLSLMEDCYKMWRFKINQTNHTTFTLNG